MGRVSAANGSLVNMSPKEKYECMQTVASKIQCPDTTMKLLGHEGQATNCKFVSAA
jgi:hypothetical protein